jgi:hypothetical protein
MYEAIKLNLAKKGWKEGSFQFYSIPAAVAGITCNVLTNPFWVVRTRMQAEIFRSSCEIHYEK